MIETGRDEYSTDLASRGRHRFLQITDHEPSLERRHHGIGLLSQYQDSIKVRGDGEVVAYMLPERSGSTILWSARLDI